MFLVLPVSPIVALPCPYLASFTLSNLLLRRHPFRGHKSRVTASAAKRNASNIDSARRVCTYNDAWHHDGL